MMTTEWDAGCDRQGAEFLDFGAQRASRDRGLVELAKPVIEACGSVPSLPRRFRQWLWYAGQDGPVMSVAR